MNTQPMDEYLNRERLTDLAQFAVPDGHDLWPKIERAARASSSSLATPRTGILSLGLSRAWTAVGVLLIAATFAALGFGLAVLVLSNGHDQVPAAPVTPTPAAATATPIPPTPSTSSATPMPPTQQADANTPPLYEADYPKDLDHIRDTLGSVFVPTYVPDGYQLTEAEVNINELRRLVMWVEHEAALRYGNGFRGIEGTPIGEFSILQFPEGWDPTKLNPDFGEVSALNPEFEESTVDGLTIWQDPELQSPGFHFQVDGRWLWISVFGAPNDTVDLNELVKVAKSVKRFGEGDPVDWLAVSGITRHGFENTALADLDDFIEGRNDALHLYAYLPRGLGLRSVWVSEDTGDLTLEFVLPSYLNDGKRLERVTLKTRSYAIRYRDQVDVGGSTGYVFWDTSSSEVTLVFQHDGRWFELNGSPAADRSVLDELIRMAISLELFMPSEPHERAPVQTPSTPDSWVSQNGFIQFTTGDDSFDDPLPGTHPWCFPPTRAPEDPGPWLVPSKLPEGMEQTVRDQISPHSVLRTFQSTTDRISMTQSLCAIRRLSPVSYRAVQVGDRTAYIVAAVKPSADGSTPEFDPNVARSLVMDIGHGVVSFNVFGSVTVEDLVDMAASLVPEELTDAEKGPYPQAVLDALGTSFGPVYVPSKLPEGYEMLGQLQARQEALEPRTSRLSYVRVSDGYCVFHLNQAALRQQFPNVVQRAQRGDETSYTVTDETGQSVRATAKWGTVEIDGVTIYAQKFSAQPRNEFTDVYFQSQGVWFEMTINLVPYCGHSLEMVAEIAKSLEPLQP